VNVVDKDEVLAAMLTDPRPDSELSNAEIIERNLRAVDIHFHNENPDDVERAVAIYADDITWEAPARGLVLKDSGEVLSAYRRIFTTVAIRRNTSLRRFATERYVFDDQLGQLVVIGDPEQMLNLPFARGTEISLRIAHCFELRDGRITREIAYELWREAGGACDHDEIPDGSPTQVFPPPPA
jgi:ketosteroid isomerase-like protein